MRPPIAAPPATAEGAGSQRRHATPAVTRRWLLLGAGAWLLATACERQRAGESRGGRGHDPRVVSLSPSTTEAMFALGIGRLLVGRSHDCDYPPAALSLPSVGGFAHPNLESILALRPSLVIGSRSPAGPQIQRRLRAHDVPTLFPPTGSVTEVEVMLRTLGQRLGAKTAAEQLARRIDARIDRIRRWLAGKSHPNAVMVFDAHPIFVAGPGSFGDALLTLAGGHNLITRGGAYPTIDIERLLALDPDVIIDATTAVDDGKPSRLPSSPGWSELRAVRQGRVRRLHNAAALRPGPRIAEGAADVARALHGVEPPS